MDQSTKQPIQVDEKPDRLCCCHIKTAAKLFAGIMLVVRKGINLK